MEEKWWKFLHHVQLDLEEENNFKRQMRHSSLLTLCPRPSFSPVSYSQLTDLSVCEAVHQCFPAQELFKCIKKGRSDVPVRILALTTSSVFFFFLFPIAHTFLFSCVMMLLCLSFHHDLPVTGMKLSLKCFSCFST